ATGQPRTPDVAIDSGGRVLATWTDYSVSPNPIYEAVDLNGLGVGGFGARNLVTVDHLGFQRLIPAQPQRGISAKPNIDVDRSSGLHAGRIYVSYAELGLAGPNDVDIFLRFSDD